MICASTLRASDTGIAKPIPMRAARLGKDRAVDADEVARRVDERAAGVAGIDRRIGLDEVLEAIDAEMVAPERADDAHRDGVAEAERIADREHDVADLQMLHRAERDGRQVFAVGLEHGEIRFGIDAAHMRMQLASIGQYELDIVGAFDDVVIREHVAFGRDDDAGAEARGAAGAPRSASSGK